MHLRLALEHREQNRKAIAIEPRRDAPCRPVDRRRDERLDLDEQRPRPLRRRDDERTGRRTRTLGEEELARVRDLAQALADQMNRKPSNPIPWLIGGLGIIVVGGLVYFNMSTKLL